MELIQQVGAWGSHSDGVGKLWSQSDNSWMLGELVGDQVRKIFSKYKDDHILGKLLGAEQHFRSF